MQQQRDTLEVQKIREGEEYQVKEEELKEVIRYLRIEVQQQKDTIKEVKKEVRQKEGSKEQQTRTEEEKSGVAEGGSTSNDHLLFHNIMIYL